MYNVVCIMCCYNYSIIMGRRYLNYAQGCSQSFSGFIEEMDPELCLVALHQTCTD